MLLVPHPHSTKSESSWPRPVLTAQCQRGPGTTCVLNPCILPEVVAAVSSQNPPTPDLTARSTSQVLQQLLPKNTQIPHQPRQLRHQFRLDTLLRAAFAWQLHLRHLPLRPCRQCQQEHLRVCTASPCLGGHEATVESQKVAPHLPLRPHLLFLPAEGAGMKILSATIPGIAFLPPRQSLTA